MTWLHKGFGRFCVGVAEIIGNDHHKFGLPTLFEIHFNKIVKELEMLRTCNLLLLRKMRYTSELRSAAQQTGDQPMIVKCY